MDTLGPVAHRTEQTPGILDAVDHPDDLRRLFEATLLLGSNLDLGELLQRIVDEARSLIGCRYAALGVLDREGTGLDRFVYAGLDPAAEQVLLRGTFPEGRGVLGAIIDDPRPLRLRSIAEHHDSVGFPEGHPPMTSFLGVPILVGGRAYGNLYLTEKYGDGEFDERDEVLLEALAAVAGLAVENARLLLRSGEVAVYQERERLARDLHDGVIQRLFAIGLGLQGLAAGPEGAPLAGTLTSAVADLDETIRQIRSSIFELGGYGTGQGIRTRILALVDELHPMLGFPVPVTFDGAVEAGVDAHAAEQILITVREGLTNVARHAGATSASVRLSVSDGRCRLEITDDGRGGSSAAGPDGGSAAGPGSGLGLANLARRAERLGGTVTLAHEEAGGTTLTWDVPVAPVGPAALLSKRG